MSTIIRSESARTASQSPRNRPNSTGGARLKLEVFGSIPGYHLYWENDENAAIEQLLAEGFEFALPTEVGMKEAVQRHNIVADTDAEGKVSKYVGLRADGSAMRAYLMKCTDEIWQEREDARQEQPDYWEDQIREGKATSVENSYKPAGAQISVKSNDRL